MHMKMLRLLARYILILLACAGLVYALAFLHHLARLAPNTVDPVVQIHPEVLSELYVLSLPLVMVASLSCLFAIAHHDKHRFLLRLELMALVSATLFGVFTAYKFWNEKTADLPERVALQDHTVYAGSGVFIYPENSGPDGMEGLWYRPGVASGAVDPAKTRIRRLARVEFQEGNSLIVLPDTPALKLSSLNGSLDSLYEDPGTSALTLSFPTVREGLLQFVKSASTSLVMAGIYAFSLAFALVSLWFWVRLSRWPLWNGMWVVAWVCGMFVLINLLQNPASMRLFQAIHPLAAMYAVPGAMLTIGLLLSFLTLLLPPFKDWKKEVGR